MRIQVHLATESQIAELLVGALPSQRSAKLKELDGLDNWVPAEVLVELVKLLSKSCEHKRLRE